ncbi:SH3b domain-containing protein [Sulfidibacter corallicola]|uniref:SH3b domain-containing protein n=2 Tax=Sulfidibacter corallicola TaxID=2818388 RepID=A0A8A4TM05_SULCO|nr:hypothetical protein J3U87_00995 [Sulfidibacter corallicola]
MIMSLALCLLYSASTDGLWQEANQAYQEERFDIAAEKYESLLAEGAENGKIHYNLGNAYFKSQKLGKAILHYYRAEKFLPGDDDIHNNLTLANESRVDPIIENEDEAFLRSVDLLWNRMNYSTVFYLSLLFLVVGGLASLVIVIRPKSGKWLGYVMVIGATLGLLLMGTAFLQYRQLSRNDFAVILAAQVEVLAGPSTRETVNFTIHEGIRCQILDESPGWFRIRLANGYNGWVPRAVLEVI